MGSDSKPAHTGVALLFPGQGAQQQHMAAGLYAAHAPFRERMDAALAAFGRDGDALRADWLAKTPRVDPDDVRRAQPLLFCVDWALGRTLLDWGLRPDALLGHSVGEIAASALSGVLALDEAAALMAERVAHIAEAPPGGMLAVLGSPAEMARYVDADVVVGAVNGPRQVILAGPTEPLAAVEARLRADGFVVRRTRALSPFHSPALAEAAAKALPALARVPFREPRLPLYSAYSAGPMTAAEAKDPAFWAGHPTAPVLFWPAVEAVLATGPYLFVEAGPGQGLTSLVVRHPAVGKAGALGMLPARAGRGGEAELAAVRNVAELLVARGHLAASPV